MRKRITWFGYGIFGVLAVLLFLYVCFPSEAARQYLEGLASRMEPTVVLSIEGVRPALPFGLKADRACFRLRDDPGFFLFKADSFVVMPSWLTVALLRPVVRFDCRAYGGTIKGVISSSTLDFRGPFSSDLEISGMHLDRYTALKEKLTRECSGTMDGTFTYGWTEGGFLRGSGDGGFSVFDGRIFFAEPLMDLEGVDFRRIDVEMALGDQKISLGRFDFFGRQMEAAASGTIHLDPVFDRSGLELTISVKPSSDFLSEKRELFDAVRFVTKRLQEGRFTLNVGGTVAHPMINFI